MREETIKNDCTDTDTWEDMRARVRPTVGIDKQDMRACTPWSRRALMERQVLPSRLILPIKTLNP
jgi:hypothetical protein